MTHFVSRKSRNILKRIPVVSCVFTQGEKGEPGVIVAADGSILSPPSGPKGIKVQQNDP